MRAWVLSENTGASDEFGSEHGLSLFIEACGRKILFDTGQSGLFIKNAEKLGIDVSQADICVISHGHYDHGGGIKPLLDMNQKCRVYIKEKAFDNFYSDNRYIGLDKSLRKDPRMVFTSEHEEIEQGIRVFSGVKGRECFPIFNKNLHKEGDNDDFSHEQSLVITEGNKTALFAGCAHNGIINIINRLKELNGGIAPDYVIGGFHLSDRKTGKCEENATVKKIARFLAENGTKHYTCHCTGKKGYELLRGELRDRLEYISAGQEINI